MPFRVDEDQNFFKLFNLTKKQYAKKNFKSIEGAIGFAKNAIRFREKKSSRVLKKNGKTFILPTGFKAK